MSVAESLLQNFYKQDPILVSAWLCALVIRTPEVHSSSVATEVVRSPRVFDD